MRISSAKTCPAIIFASSIDPSLVVFMPFQMALVIFSISKGTVRPSLFVMVEIGGVAGDFCVERAVFFFGMNGLVAN